MDELDDIIDRHATPPAESQERVVSGTFMVDPAEPRWPSLHGPFINVVDENGHDVRINIGPEDPVVLFACTQDGYDVYYAPSLGEATYRFATGSSIEVSHLTRRQVEYYETSGYWQRV